MNTFNTIFPATPAVVGMVHLRALPGSPGYQGKMDDVIRAAVTDAEAVAGGGADGIMVENFWDAPFTAGRVEAHTAAAMAVCVHEIRKAVDIPVGVNVLRNDGESALSIAAVTGARFIRVNVLTHAMVTDQGIIQGRAYELSRRQALLGALPAAAPTQQPHTGGSPVLVFADVMVKHAYPLGEMDIQTAAKDIARRGGADVLVVSGSGTGAPIEEKELAAVREAVPGFPVASGSGITPENLEQLAPHLDVIIVGTWIKRDGRVENPVDPKRVREITGGVHRR